MRMAFLIIAAAVMSVFAPAQVLLQDDFNDNSLNLTLWSPNISCNGYGSPDVTELNQQLQLFARGYLVTAQQYQPSLAHPLQITGTWRFDNVEDMFQVLTRSDGVPVSGWWCETTSGVEAYIYGLGGDVRIFSRTGGVFAELAAATAPFSFVAGTVYTFTILDDGQNFTFTFSNPAVPAETVTLTAATTYSSGSNYIVFHNREMNYTSYLDDVVIADLSAPIPALGAAGLLALALLLGTAVMLRLRG